VSRAGGGSLSSRVGSAGRAPLLLALLTFVCIGLGTGTLAASARAEGCPNEQLREQDGYAVALPDCRAYEQVSPVDKNFTDALGEVNVVQSSPSGEGVTFFSIAPFPGVLSAASIPTYLSSRGAGEWSTQGLAPPADHPTVGGSEEGLTEGLTEDLSDALILVEPGLDAGMTPGVYSYLRDSSTGAFRLLGPGIARLADATADDSRILFEDTTKELVPGVLDENEVPYLYEWNGSRPPGEELSLAGVLPDGKAPVDGSVAGPGGPALGRSRGGATGEFYTENTISEVGSRIFFSDVETGRIYMREPEAARTIPVSAGPAYWRAATADGSEVFYTEGEDLYRFDVESETREALTSGAAGVLGTLGIATENGSYVYFVAGGVLADNENGNKEKAEVGEGNLYEWHNGETIFVARLSIGSEYDEYDWRDFYRSNPDVAPAAGEKGSRVTPDGTTVLFASRARLTSYDNTGQGELYLYDATSGTLTCVSCNPSGAPATSEVYLAGNPSIVAVPERDAFLTRNLSEGGSRVFFQTQEALVQQDTNEQMDVYEWEREGTGGPDGCSRSSASFSERSGGCLYLISTGESSDPSYFGDASADGSDVFFFTRQSLVSQDRDENDDLYDARVEGGIAAQNPPPPASCTGEGCLGPVDPVPAFGAPSNATFAGAGNLKPPPAKPKKVLVRCPRGKKRSHGRCRMKKKAKRPGHDRRTSR
jgi:hypothetical protein